MHGCRFVHIVSSALHEIYLLISRSSNIRDHQICEQGKIIHLLLLWS
jgi:hypothetical protein